MSCLQVQVFVNCKNMVVIFAVHVVIRGRTDKKLTSTLVIQTFLSFELADIF